MKKPIVLGLSGGLDSTALLATLLHRGQNVQPVIFTYGSKHNVYENLAAERICEYYNITPIKADMTAIMSTFNSNLLKSGGVIPEGHYTDDSMKKTVVPSRNLIFISIMAGIAESICSHTVALGVHAGDHAIYPDCRPEFIESANKTIEFSSENRVGIIAPFLYDHKGIVLKNGLSAGMPAHLTRTCYKDQPMACGKCGSCTERLEAFEFMGLKDPIEYED